MTKRTKIFQIRNSNTKMGSKTLKYLKVLYGNIGGNQVGGVTLRL